MTTNTDGRPQQDRALATRDRLLVAARLAFAEHGHDGVNLTTHILEPAGVSVGSFYHQFRDKTDLLIAILDVAADQRQDLVLRLGLAVGQEGELGDAVRSGFDQLLTSLDDERHLWRIQLHERGNSDTRIRARVMAGRQSWVAQVADALEPWSKTDRVTVERGAAMIVNLALGLATVYLDLPPDKRDSAKAGLAADASILVEHGIAPFLRIDRESD